MSFWVAGAVVGAGVINSMGQQSAAKTQADAINQGTQTQKSMFDTEVANQKPYMDAGGTALKALMYGQGLGGDPGTSGMTSGQFTKGFSPTDFTNNLDPGYQFQLDTGGQAVRNADTPTQGALSGSALKDLMSFNQNMAGTGYQNAFNRFQTTQNNIFSRLSGIAGLGQSAAANVGNNGTTLGTGIAQSQAASGAATAGGQVGVANAIGSSAVPVAYLMSQNGGGTNLSSTSYNPNAGGTYADPALSNVTISPGGA